MSSGRTDKRNILGARPGSDERRRTSEQGTLDERSIPTRMATMHSPPRTRSQAAASAGAETGASSHSQDAGATVAGTSAFEAVHLELQNLREERRLEQQEQQLFRSEMEARLKERDAAMARLQEQLAEYQLSPSNNVSRGVMLSEASCEIGAGEGACAGRAACGNSVEPLRVMGASVGSCAGRTACEGSSGTLRGLKLKPDTFDGTAPLREFLAQFLLIARANLWTEAEKAVVLASCLRGKARSLLESCADGIKSLTYAELTEKLELRFGEGHLSQNYYSLFTNRKQRFGEEYVALGSDLERLSRLAYPECTYAVRDKIACSQFVSALFDGFVKRTLQLEGVTSLKIAVERAKAVKAIQGESFGERNRGGKFFNKNGGTSETANPILGEQKEKENVKEGEKRKFVRSKPKECWLCGRQGHFRNECPDKKENAV